MAIRIVRFSQDIPAKLLENGLSFNRTDDMSASPDNGALHVILIPENLPKCCGLRSTIGECLWSDRSNFRNLFAKEIYKVIRHVRTPSLTVVLQHRTLGGQLLTVQYIMTERDIVGYAGIPAAEDGEDKLFTLCQDIVDRMVLQLIDTMSFNIKPSYYTASDCSVPRDLLPNDLLVDGTAPSLIESKISDMKAEVDDLRRKMFEATAVPASKMNPDYATAKDILDGNFDKYLGRDKKTDKSGAKRDDTALSPLRSNADDIKTEFDRLRNKTRALEERSEDDGDSMFQSSKTSWI